MEIEEDESKSCSASCYLDIKKNKLDKISAIKYRVMSPFVKSLI